MSDAYNIVLPKQPWMETKKKKRKKKIKTPISSSSEEENKELQDNGHGSLNALQRHSHAPILVQLKNEISKMNISDLKKSEEDKDEEDEYKPPMTDVQKKQIAR